MFLSILVFLICFWLRCATAICESLCFPDLPRKVGYPKYISVTKIGGSKVLVFILFALYCFKLSLKVLNYLGWLNEILFVYPYKKISQINGNLLRRVLIPSLLNNLLDFVFL